SDRPTRFHSVPTRRSSDLAGLRMVFAEVRATRILARDRRFGDDAAHRDQAAQVQPVVPAQVERAPRIGDPGSRQLRVELAEPRQDRKSTRLNSSHVKISYA